MLPISVNPMLENTIAALFALLQRCNLGEEDLQGSSVCLLTLLWILEATNSQVPNQVCPSRCAFFKLLANWCFTAWQYRTNVLVVLADYLSYCPNWTPDMLWSIEWWKERLLAKQVSGAE